MRPRTPLSGDYLTVALYFQSLMDKANTFSTIKSASAFTIYFHKIHLFTYRPTMALEACMVRAAAARKFGLSTKRVEKSFLLFQSEDCAL